MSLFRWGGKHDMHGGMFVLFDDNLFSFMTHVLSVFEFRCLCNL